MYSETFETIKEFLEPCKGYIYLTLILIAFVSTLKSKYAPQIMQIKKYILTYKEIIYFTLILMLFFIHMQKLGEIKSVLNGIYYMMPAKEHW